MRIGNLFMLGFHGAKVPAWLKEFEQKYGLGGVILFDYYVQTKKYENNIYSRDQVKDLCNEIKAMQSSPLIYVDQEGGKVRRLKAKLGFEEFPSAKNFNLLDVNEKKSFCQKAFAEMKNLGFDVDLLPVIDIDYNSDNPDIGKVERSYSQNPNEIYENFKIINKVAGDTKLGLCLKHFPGLGGARVNSHEDLTDLTGTITDDQLNLFYKAAKEMHSKAILISHGINKKWDEKPCSVSSIALDLLRKNTSDEVIFISDDIQMQGMQKIYGTVDAALLGLKAGLDMIIIGNNMLADEENVFKAVEKIIEECKQDSTFAEKLSKSESRILNYKNKIRVV